MPMEMYTIIIHTRKLQTFGLRVFPEWQLGSTQVSYSKEVKNILNNTYVIIPNPVIIPDHG